MMDAKQCCSLQIVRSRSIFSALSSLDPRAPLKLTVWKAVKLTSNPAHPSKDGNSRPFSHTQMNDEHFT